MTKNAILKKIRKTLFCTFTFTLILSMFSCSVSDDNDETQSNAAAKNESPILSENNANITPDKSQNNPEQTEKDKNSEKNVTENTVTLCDDIQLYKKELSASNINLLVNDTLEHGARLQAKIRYRHKPASATVIRTSSNTLSVIFDEPQRAITCGQSLVLYDGDTVIGGGIIE